MPAEIGMALLGTGLGLGLRHGIDWDHIAAISDVAGSQKNRRRSLGMGTLYAIPTIGIGTWYATKQSFSVGKYQDIVDAILDGEEAQKDAEAK